MITFRLIMGVLFIALGGIGLYGYITKNEKFFSKKDKIKSIYGARGGTVFHFVKYIIGPIVLGAVIVVSELIGR